MVAQVVMMVWVTWYVNRRMKREVTLACERDAIARNAMSMNRSASQELLQTLVHPSERVSSASNIPSDTGDLLDSWMPFEVALGMDDGLSREPSGERDSRPLAAPGGHGPPSPSREGDISEWTPASRKVSDGRGHRRTRSADLGVVRLPSTAGVGATSVKFIPGRTPVDDNNES